MTTQITIRIPDDQVAYLDQLVRDGEAKSRAGAVTRALKREQRRRRAEQDTLTLLAVGPEADPKGLATWQLENAAQSWDYLDDTDWSHLA